MDIQKYRKWYLEVNWGENKFVMIKYGVEFNQIRKNNQILTLDFQKNHPLILSGNAFWITHNTLCIGYQLRENTEIFRPIFSHKRQRLLDKVNLKIHNPIKFWNKIKSVYFKTLYHIKMLPIECINNIVIFTSK